MNSGYDLERFIMAQNQDDCYCSALKEIQNEKKVTHWMWFIFPQLKELGKSSYSKYYGITGIDEAKSYMCNEILKKRLIEITNALVKLKSDNLVNVVGFVDAQKIHASMTLFHLATEKKCFEKVLNKYFNGNYHNKTCQYLFEKKIQNKKEHIFKKNFVANHINKKNENKNMINHYFPKIDNKNNLVKKRNNIFNKKNVMNNYFPKINTGSYL